jgi:hypothetical protein
MRMHKLEVPAKIREYLDIPGLWRTDRFKSASEVWVGVVNIDDYVVDFKVCSPSYGLDEEPATCWCEAVVFERSLDDNLYEIDAVVGDDLHGVWDFNINGNKYSVEVVYA